MSEKRIETKSLADINEKIQEIYTYLPKELFRDEKAPRTKDGKPNKGMILTAAVSHLLDLQNQVDVFNREEIELMVRLEELQKQEKQKFGKNIVDTSQINFENTSAEIALGAIGVGPLAGQMAAASSPSPSPFTSSTATGVVNGLDPPSSLSEIPHHERSSVSINAHHISQNSPHNTRESGSMGTPQSFLQSVPEGIAVKEEYKTPQ
ncbi:hypothetical protein ACO0QE_000323 [Hanseniaspora vineae]